jgi:hypothetical protein
MQNTLSTRPANGRHNFQSRTRITDRIRARLHATKLDRELASGVSPAANPVLGLRAAVLTRPSVARQLGDQLRRIVREAHQPPGPSVRVRGCRERVLAAEDDLRLLASRLQGTRVPAVRGIAKVHVLFADGCGPLYHRSSAENLSAAIRDATAALS